MFDLYNQYVFNDNLLHNTSLQVHLKIIFVYHKFGIKFAT
jgi:hypothetical protein